MTDITCYVGLFRSHLELPVDNLSNGWASLPHHFALGATLSPTHTALRLQVDQTTRLKDSVTDSRYPTDILFLQRALQRLTLNRPGQRLVNNIGLLFADHLARFPRVLGIMFDPGFDLPELGTVDNSYHQVAREGCAVFLDAIAQLRGLEGDDYRREAVFTAVHELGHVFNLWHQQNPISFMATSHSVKSYPLSAFQFLPEHKFALQNVANEHIHPGGKPLGTRGMFGPTGERNPLNFPKSKEPLSLQIEIQPREFWRFEPVELEVGLYFLNMEDSFQVPLELDPGYERFAIWIEEPDGTVRRYRPTRYYCQADEKICVTKNKPYERDISIFGQSAGYTFNVPGPHQLWVSFEILDGTVILSNRLEINIKQAAPHLATYQRIEQALTHRGAARLLFYRGGTTPHGALNVLNDLLTGKMDNCLRASLEYALGRFHANASKRTVGHTQKQHLKISNRYLRNSLERMSLTSHRRACANEVLQKITNKSL